MAKKKTKATASTADPTLDAQPQAAASAGVTSRGAWRALDAGASILAAMAAPALTKVVWRSVTGKPAPKSARSSEITMAEAILWAALAGAFAQVIRNVAARSAATYWEHSTGSKPPSKGK